MKAPSPTLRIEEEYPVVDADTGALPPVLDTRAAYVAAPPRSVITKPWRHGRASLIDLGKGSEVPMRDMVGELLGFVDDLLDEMGSRARVEYALRTLAEGTGADRRLRVLEDTGGLSVVVHRSARESAEGIA